MHKIIGHSNFHPKSLNNGFLRLWPLDYEGSYFLIYCLSHASEAWSPAKAHLCLVATTLRENTVELLPWTPHPVCLFSLYYWWLSCWVRVNSTDTWLLWTFCPVIRCPHYVGSTVFSPFCRGPAYFQGSVAWTKERLFENSSNQPIFYLWSIQKFLHLGIIGFRVKCPTPWVGKMLTTVTKGHTSNLWRKYPLYRGNATGRLISWEINYRPLHKYSLKLVRIGVSVMHIP